jgi:hypothetical protein
VVSSDVYSGPRSAAIICSIYICYVPSENRPKPVYMLYLNQARTWLAAEFG